MAEANALITISGLGIFTIALLWFALKKLGRGYLYDKFFGKENLREEQKKDIEKIKEVIVKEEICKCELKPEHKVLEHDWCCQICGGQHTERICPSNVTNMSSMPSSFRPDYDDMKKKLE